MHNTLLKFIEQDTDLFSVSFQRHGEYAVGNDTESSILVFLFSQTSV